MHLYGEILTGVDELHQQGKLVAELLIDFLSDEQTLVLVDQFYQRQSLIDIINQSSVHGHALMSGNTTDFPTLAHIGLRIENTFERCNLITTPDGGLQIRLKFIWLHLFLFFAMSFLIVSTEAAVVSPSSGVFMQ